MVKYKFRDCWEPNTLRVCSGFEGVAHHICSNEYIVRKASHLQDCSSVFCSSLCIKNYVEENEAMQNSIRNIRDWNIEDSEDDGDSVGKGDDVECENSYDMHEEPN